jgi:CheY-like chemotaxis protein
MAMTSQTHQIPILPKSVFSQATMEGGQSVLVIDDDPDFAEAIKSLLERNGHYHVNLALDPFEGANLLADRRYDLVVTDCMLQDWDGVTTLENADHLIDVDPTVSDQWEKIEPVKVLFCSSAPIRLGDLRRANKLNHFSVVGFLPKITGLASICRSVEKLTRGIA